MTKEEIKINSDQIAANNLKRLETLESKKNVVFTWKYENVHKHKESEIKEDKEAEKDIFTLPHVHIFTVNVAIEQSDLYRDIEPAAARVMCQNRFADFNAELSGKTCLEQVEFIRIELHKLLKSSVPITVEVNDNNGTGAKSSTDSNISDIVAVMDMMSGKILELQSKIDVLEGAKDEVI